MAQIIPDTMPSGASQGEKRVFSALQNLSDDCLIFYEPAVNRRYPDFVAIIPTIGVLIIEVKGWYLANIERADTQTVVVHEQGRSVEHKNPDRQARDYLFSLMDVVRAFPAAACLTNTAPPYQGRFSFPFGRLTVLSNITREQLENDRAELSSLFASPGVATRDELLAWLELPGEQLLDRLKAAFDPVWPITRLTDQQIKTLRAVLHPEHVLPGQSPDLKILDLRQSGHAQSIGEGHRLVYGVAGSGKTVILIARAKLLAQHPGKRILLLCFNRFLADYLAQALKEYSAVLVFSFYRWGRTQGAEFRDDEGHEPYGARLRSLLEAGAPDTGAYDAVLIDEGQDFACSWFQCAKLALKEPDDGDLLIMADGSQSIFRSRSFTWKDAGIKAVGRTISQKLDLQTNYRNTSQILSAACSFAGRCDNTELSLALPVSAANAIRQGPTPEIIRCENRIQECETAVNLVRAWLETGIEGMQGGALKPQEIGFLYPRLTAEDQPSMDMLCEDLSKFTSVVALRRGTKGKLTDSGVKILTTMAVKGLQFRAVILLWADKLPSDFRNRDEAAERMQLYVAMTRAEDFLAIIHSGPSPYIEEIRNNISFSLNI